MVSAHERNWRRGVLALLTVAGFAVAGALLAACEPASCWNEIKGRYTDCAQMRADEIDRELDRRGYYEREADIRR